jgi:nicotinate-nucleotide adenylyltransferase
MFQGFPLATEGLRVGLLGGSFDPPHSGHALITRRALRRFGLDYVWWLVSPGNPLKEEGPASMERRLKACRALMHHPRVVFTDIEARLGTRYTADTLSAIKAHYPDVRFMWLMGADNLADFHRWENWRGIIESMPLGVLSRPGDQIAAGLSPTAQAYAFARRPVHEAHALIYQPPPAWCLLSGPMLEISSTDIRRDGRWVR